MSVPFRIAFVGAFLWVGLGAGAALLDGRGNVFVIVVFVTMIYLVIDGIQGAWYDVTGEPAFYWWPYWHHRTWAQGFPDVVKLVVLLLAYLIVGYGVYSVVMFPLGPPPARV